MLQDKELFDILIIGGGINGTGIARDAAGRGLKVLLCEKADLASGTSSASTKLIHGGLRYLEHYEFRLVREALIEREILLRAAPHIIWPMRFVLPYHKALRSPWLIRAGLFLYDHLGRPGLLPTSRTIDLLKSPLGLPLQPNYSLAFEYSDCWVDDARLVILNAVDAARHGAQIMTRTTFKSARSKDGIWEVEMLDMDKHTYSVNSRALVNAAGPWVVETLDRINGHQPTNKSLRKVKGSHIVVNRLFQGEHAYIFQHADDRIIFALPYQRDFTLIGTTEIPYTDNLEDILVSDAEVKYLCDAVNAYFNRVVKPENVVWQYSGVRPLYEDGSSRVSTVTRDYVFDLDNNKAPLLSIYGGKITTYRRLAEHALKELEKVLRRNTTTWTQSASLPGGDITNADFNSLQAQMSRKYYWLPRRSLYRMLRAYGTRIETILGNAKSTQELGMHFGPSLSEAELEYLVNNEWARNVDDVLWRRSKLGLWVTQSEQEQLNNWLIAKLKFYDT